MNSFGFSTHGSNVDGDNWEETGASRSIHIVRNYGKTGGMERYVWELTHSLARAGHQVKIVCERQEQALELRRDCRRLQVNTVGAVWPSKPRWIAMGRFANRVDRLFRTMDTTGWVIHSHEIIGVHDVATFHGTSIRARRFTLLDRLSPRIRTWERFERLELTGSPDQRILPVSHHVADSLLAHYPECANRLESPVYPGVSNEFSDISRTTDGKTLGFIGREWRRKGLDFLVTAVAVLRRQDPEISLLVAGCDPAEVRHLFRDWNSGYRLMGWVDPVELYRQIDGLVLPARAEPFGMVAAEANAAGIPVVVSTNCGIAPMITDSRGRVVNLDQLGHLESACRSVLKLRETSDQIGLTWSNLASQHGRIYSRVMELKQAAIKI